MLGDVSSNNSIKPSTRSQEISSIPEANLLIEGIVTPSVLRTTHNTIETAGSQMRSTRDESQDSLFEETMIVAQGPIEEEQDIQISNQEQEPVDDTELTITSILEINRSISSKNSSIQEVIQTAVETVEEQSTPDPNGFAGESNIQLTSRIEALLSEAMLQESNSNELIIPRDEFTFMNDPDSLEDIVIYEMVVEYQATNINNKRKEDDDVIKIKEEQKDQTIQSHTSQLETFSASQIPIDHEEVVAAQDPFDQPPEEIEDWSTILSRGKQQENWGREGIHEFEFKRKQYMSIQNLNNLA